MIERNQKIEFPLFDFLPVEMSFTVDTFKNLCSSYASWSSLETFLTSPEGGNLRVVGSDRYRILRYVKGQSDFKIQHTKWFRSVIWDTVTNRPVCVAPPKAENTEPPTGEDIKLSIQDFLDGTMINAFISSDEPTRLQIASRTQLGAGGTFYSEKTFGDLFDEALTQMGYDSRADLASVLSKPSHEETATFFSFLLQHPEHRVVSRPRVPKLFLVHTGSVSKNGSITITEKTPDSLSSFQIQPYPMTGFKKQSDLDSFFKGLVDSKGWFFQGLTLKDGAGRRWRIRNENYLTLRALRGSEATSTDRFLRLRSEGKVVEYLKHYSEDRQIFWDLEQKLRAMTKTVFDSYCEVHKAHAKKLADLPKSIQPCVFRLHSLYLSDLKPQSQSVLMKHAVEIVNKMPVFEQRRLLA
jgi:hypothetical protein